MRAWRIKETWDRSSGYIKRYQCPYCDHWSYEEHPYCPKCGTRLVRSETAKRDYLPVMCVRSGFGFESGTIYALVGRNNGDWIHRADEHGNATYLICHDYGNVMYPPDEFNNPDAPMFEVINDEHI